METKFKEGDVVQIKSSVWYNSNKDKNGNICVTGYPCSFTKTLRWVLSIPFFISCIRQQNPLTVLSKIILRKVKQFNLPPQKK